jgi:hypothetical protein
MNIVINLTADDVIAWLHERMVTNVCAAEGRRLRRDLTDTERERIRRIVQRPTLDDVIARLQEIRRAPPRVR